ncbi:hypothetical protein F4680DRAFT_413101 [Xylaria scruposa]|nr:hypothetical protein F4680DRAFT_413101 [Xylaria scruposa]
MEQRFFTFVTVACSLYLVCREVSTQFTHILAQLLGDYHVAVTWLSAPCSAEPGDDLWALRRTRCDSFFEGSSSRYNRLSTQASTSNSSIMLVANWTLVRPRQTYEMLQDGGNSSSADVQKTHYPSVPKEEVLYRLSLQVASLHFFMV